MVEVPSDSSKQVLQDRFNQQVAVEVDKIYIQLREAVKEPTYDLFIVKLKEIL